MVNIAGDKRKSRMGSNREALLLVALVLSNVFWIFSSQQACDVYHSSLALMTSSTTITDKSNVAAAVVVKDESGAKNDGNGFSKNEETYDKKYWEWQAHMNKFGAAFKGDIIRHVTKAHETAIDKILEFGCSGGYILDSMSAVGNAKLYGVEINPAARAFAQDTFSKSIAQVFLRPEDIPNDLIFDVIYTTSVLEHVDCPLCELRKLKSKLHPETGVLVVGLKNDGADHAHQTFAFQPNDPNHHIYTWNALLLANMLNSAGYKPCHAIGQFDAWHEINVGAYQRNKYAYCTKSLQVGKQNNVHNLWAVAVPDNAAATASCQRYQKQLGEILNCQYLKP